MSMNSARLPVPYSLRKSCSLDEAFVCSAYLAGASELFRFATPATIHTHGRKWVLNQMQSGNVWVAYDTEQSWYNYGFVIFETPVVHWIYVKSNYWGLGIGRALFTKTKATIASHMSGIIAHGNLKGICARYGVIYSPWSLDTSAPVT
jgi:hypothetical protein